MARTLQNFGVPTGNDVMGKGILQPKLQYRFRVVVSGFGLNGVGEQTYLTRQVINVTRPNITTSEVRIDSYNSVSYVAGKHEWQTLSLTLRDDVGNHLTKLIGSQVQKQLDHKTQRGPKAGENYKFDMRIEMMDGNSAEPIETWMIEGAFISSADYTQLDYGTSEAVQITLTVRFDNAVQEDHMPEVESYNNAAENAGNIGTG
jgi:hypothetical protein